MIFVPNEVRDGCYLLDLQVPAFMSDAAPSRPSLRTGMKALEIRAPNGEKEIDPSPARKLIEHGGYWPRNEELKGAEEAAKPWPADTRHGASRPSAPLPG